MGESNGPAHLVTTSKNHFSHPKTGKFQIDIIINNAGVAKNEFLPNVSTFEFERQYRINVLGPLLLVQAAMEYLPHDRSGRIVNLSSVSSSEGFMGQSIYGGTKAALEAMTRTWSRELNSRATVNAINPGPVKTDMWSQTTQGFKESMRDFMKHTPGAQIRPDVDDTDLVADAENAGGRPAYVEEVSFVSLLLSLERYLKRIQLERLLHELCVP
jgi:3-oxoacyl-[acyl-carrier protein] reductase